VSAPPAALARSRFSALGTTAVVVTDERALEAATEVVAAEVAAVDLACSRFRSDSGLSAVNDGAGHPVAASSTLLNAVEVALEAAAATDGLVDPTIGRVVRILGYDRDFALVERQGPPLHPVVTTVPGWQTVRVDRTTGMITVPHGVELDLGATAKAWCADRAAAAAAARCGSGVLVSLGGDIAVAGPSLGGWLVRLADEHDAPTDGPGPAVVIDDGGLATSSTVRRRWERGGDELHHLIDPRTGRPAAIVWRTVSVVAASCVGANTASTAAILLGDAAPDWLTGRRLPARLVRRSGEVVTVGGWPAEDYPRGGRRPALED
jgi:thiamine biosynthesis lipoprotein